MTAMASAEDVCQRFLVDRGEVREVLERLVIEDQDQLGLRAEDVGRLAVDGNWAGVATLVGTHGRWYLLGSCPRAVSAVAGVFIVKDVGCG
jgi:hypothetical protein